MSLRSLRLHYTPGACSSACHIALCESGAEFDTVVVPFGGNFTPKHLALNPDGFVPVLEMAEGGTLTEVVAILLHIARRYPSAGLLPAAGSVAEARVYEWLVWMTNTLHVAYAALWRPERFTTDVAAAQALSREGVMRVSRFNDDIERRLITDFAVGDTYTLADAFLLVFYRWHTVTGLDAATLYPLWTAWFERMMQRDAVARVLAIEGPIRPPKLKEA